MKKKWPSWLMGGIIGCIIGLFQPSLFIPFAIAGIFFGFVIGKIGKMKSKKPAIVPNASWVSEAGIVDTLVEKLPTGSNAQGFPISYSPQMINVRTYRDPEESLAGYKTFDFDYTNKTSPLLEKELFGQLEKVLQAHKMTRDKNNPQIIISMDSFLGKKEKYTPPATITNTQTKSVWNPVRFGFNFGGYTSQVPVTSSRTTPGYTTTSFYSNIRLNFLNRAKLIEGAKLETPPLIWLGEADSEGLTKDIREIAPVMFHELIGEFPDQSNKSSQRFIQHVIYGGLGLGFEITDWRVINIVEPSSVAAEHGLKPGDILVKINGKDVNDWNSFNRSHPYVPGLYSSKDPYLHDILSNRGDSDVELVIQSAETGENVTLKMKPRSEDRYLQCAS